MCRGELAKRRAACRPRHPRTSLSGAPNIERVDGRSAIEAQKGSSPDVVARTVARSMPARGESQEGRLTGADLPLYVPQE